MSFSNSDATRPLAIPDLGSTTGVSPPRPLSPSTRALHPTPRPTTGTPRPLVPGIVQSTTYLHRAVSDIDGPTYSRVGNPTVDHLEDVLGTLEDAPPAVTFSTGLAAETALFLALLRAGDHAVVGEAIYGGTVRLFRQVLSELGITCTFVDAADVSAVRAAITARTRLVFIETPANPTLRLTDIAAVADAVRGARESIAPEIRLAVDNTFLTPVLQRPLDLGADISVYATTKQIEGHSVALGGSVVSRDETLLERVRFIRKSTGGIQTPFNAWLTTNGVKTLAVRIKQQSLHAQQVAEWLAVHPAVKRVNYPGLHDFPQRELAHRQHKGNLHGNVVSFEIEGGTPAGIALLNGVKLCALVEHVGSVETLITHPASMTHADVPKEQRERVGLTDGLVRLSVGLEDPADIINDLAQAIEAALGTSAFGTSALRADSVSPAQGGTDLRPVLAEALAEAKEVTACATF
ncbi:MAG: trans-sulfuration enzyme family protein [Phycisphaerales bacterium]